MKSKPTTIYVLTDQLSGVRYYYGSIAAMCEDMDNPMDATADDVNNARRGGKEFPIIVDGCKIEKVHVLTVTDVRNNNPATIAPEEAERLGIKPA